LPQILRETAKVTGDVVVFGKGAYLEVANREAFVQDMEQNPLTLEDEQALANFVCKKNPSGGAHDRT